MKTAHILLVDDNEGDILLTIEAFEERRIKVEISVARNGGQALDFLFQEGEFANASKPDLVLLDINLPLFNGHEVLEKIKSDPNLKETPVIMLTTAFNHKDIIKAYENQCHSFVKKPLNIDEFLSAILKIEQFWVRLTT